VGNKAKSPKHYAICRRILFIELELLMLLKLVIFQPHAKKSGPGKIYPDGPSSHFKGKEVPCMV
jgi:hypothetical protein